MQNPVLWDECCKRAECQPGCGCPTGSYHEEDGTMCWQVLDPRWDCPHQWSCQLRHGRRTREEQMCVLKWWGAIFGVCLLVWKVTSEDSSAQQCPKLVHIQLVLGNIGEKCIVTPCVLNIHTHVCFVSSMHVCLRVKFATWTYFPFTFYIRLSKVVFLLNVGTMHFNSYICVL